MRRSLMFALVLLAATSVFAAEDTIRRGFNVAPGGTLHLDAGIGSIKVVSGGTGVAVEVIRKFRGSNGEKRLRDHKIEFRQNGNDVIIDGDFSSGWFHLFSDYEVQWNIRVPSRYNVEVTTSGGSIDLADIGGTVDAKTAGGSIRTGRLGDKAKLDTSGGAINVSSATGALVAHTSGGSIQIENAASTVNAKTSGGTIVLGRIAGDLVAHTSGGGIRIDDASGTIDATTSGGSIRARLPRQPRGDSRLETSGGGVTVEIGSFGLELDAQASGGGVSSDVPVLVRGKQEDDMLRGQIAGGGPKLVLRSSGGGVHVTNVK